MTHPDPMERPAPTVPIRWRVPAPLAAVVARLAAATAMLGGIALLAAPGAAMAQGNLGAQGYGYPPGGASIRVGGTAGAFTEFDAVTPANPAAVAAVRRPVLAMQAEPERRTVRLGDVRERTTVQRVPLAMLVTPVRPTVSAALGYSTLLDRTSVTRSTGYAVIDGDSLATRDRSSIRGALNDLRLGIGWQVNDRVALGIGGHLYTGSNLVGLTREFADTLQFGTVVDSSRLEFAGTALSVGAEVRLRRDLAVAGSWRRGNTLEGTVGDSVVGRGRVPDRLGIALRYSGIRGSVFAAGVQQQRWSGMAGLGTPDMSVRDGLTWHAGAEVEGPRLREVPLLVRAGVARRQLPFGVRGQWVDEWHWSTGLGLPIAQDRASLDLSAQRASRRLAGGEARERAWLLGIGLQVRP